jgi:hypothetical protein
MANFSLSLIYLVTLSKMTCCSLLLFYATFACLYSWILQAVKALLSDNVKFT